MTLKLLVLTIWAAIHPSAPRLRDAMMIADAIQAVISADTAPPVFGSREDDAAVMAYYALRESWLSKDAVGDGGKSFGVWQQPPAVGRADLLTQARAWLVVLHEGARICPASPAAPLSGGCINGRRVADRRASRARILLEAARKTLAANAAAQTPTPTAQMPTATAQASQ
jgi:hypothetical protein